jgi:hypothetical protein
MSRGEAIIEEVPRTLARKPITLKVEQIVVSRARAEENRNLKKVANFFKNLLTNTYRCGIIHMSGEGSKPNQ